MLDLVLAGGGNVGAEGAVLLRDEDGTRARGRLLVNEVRRRHVGLLHHLVERRGVGVVAFGKGLFVSTEANRKNYAHPPSRTDAADKGGLALGAEHPLGYADRVLPRATHNVLDVRAGRELRVTAKKAD